MNTITEGTVSGWKQAYTDVTNGLYEKISELKHSESVVAELEKEVEELKLENEKLKSDYKREVAWTLSRIDEFVKRHKRESDETDDEEERMLRYLIEGDQ
tara:strand:- start:29 stop:328 length:300 start_codon:yes stop_codon:yes gene_type:complete